MKKGFTIFELVIVIMVMMVLGFITYTQFEEARAKARDVSRKSDLNEVSKAIQKYYADYGHLPQNGNDDDPDLNSLWGKQFKDSTGYVYLEKMPEEKYLAEKPYCYEPSPESNYFRLFAEFENDKDPDCKENHYTCGGRSYCYTDINYVVLNSKT